MLSLLKVSCKRVQGLANEVNRAILVAAWFWALRVLPTAWVWGSGFGGQGVRSDLRQLLDCWHVLCEFLSGSPLWTSPAALEAGPGQVWLGIQGLARLQYNNWLPTQAFPPSCPFPPSCRFPPSCSVAFPFPPASACICWSASRSVSSRSLHNTFKHPIAATVHCPAALYRAVLPASAIPGADTRPARHQMGEGWGP